MRTRRGRTESGSVPRLVEPAPGRPAPGRRLARVERVRRHGDFQRVFDQGTRLHGRFLTAVIRPNHGQVGRLGVAATRKLGGAVQRNRAKRLVRELFRLHKIVPGFDIIVVPRPQLLDADFDDLVRDYRAVLGRRVGG